MRIKRSPAISKILQEYYPNVPFDNKPAFDFNSYRNDMIPINSFGTDIPHFVNFDH